MVEKFIMASLETYSLLWMESLKYELQAEGHTYLPKPKCDPLPIPRDLTRQEEVQLMSLCYNNNLLNGFLHRFDNQKFPNPLCHCGSEEQTNYHVAVQCSQLNTNNKAELIRNIKTAIGDTNAVPENPFIFLNASRDPKVLNLLIDSVKTQFDYLRRDIEL